MKSLNLLLLLCLAPQFSRAMEGKHYALPDKVVQVEPHTSMEDAPEGHIVDKAKMCACPISPTLIVAGIVVLARYLVESRAQ